MMVLIIGNYLLSFTIQELRVPAYCRPYARPNHPFKTPGMLCLSENGVWEKQ